jgi:hypothetical protein
LPAGGCTELEKITTTTTTTTPTPRSVMAQYNHTHIAERK